ncbi:MAG: tetratricopeptide (TPR) repeat protein [Cognaticolwellia sp.]|jgi:tetratricopeptide (TPR) repeat protein
MPLSDLEMQGLRLLRERSGALKSATLDALLAEDPGNPELMWLRAYPPFWEEDWEQAHTWLSRAWDGGFRGPDLYLDRVEVALCLPLDPECCLALAQETMHEVALDARRLALAREQLGRALSAAGREEEALEYFASQVAHAIDKAMALVEMGNLHIQLGQPRKALPVHREAVNLAVTSSASLTDASSGATLRAAQLALGVTLLNLNLPQAAIQHLEMAVLAINPKVSSRAVSSLGTAWTRLRRPDKAQAALTAGIGRLLEESPEREELLAQRRALPSARPSVKSRRKARAGSKKGKRR